MSTWPPTVADVKNDAGINVETDDGILATELDAAVAFVRRNRKRFNYDSDPLCEWPAPTDDLWLGTVRLAKRWHDRRRAAAGQIFMGDTGSDTVPYVDPDIERMLGLGRFKSPVIA